MECSVSGLRLCIHIIFVTNSGGVATAARRQSALAAESRRQNHARPPTAPLMALKNASSHSLQADTSRLTFWLLLAVLVIVLDQFTKWLIVGHYRLGDVTPVTDFFNVVRAHNTGAAFSFLAQAGGWQRWLFTGLGAAVALLIVVLLRQHGRQRLFALSLSLLLGGAVGNVIDRVVHGYVVDFLDFHWPFLAGLFHQGHFPAFNVADVAITAGVTGLLLDELLRVRRA